MMRRLKVLEEARAEFNVAVNWYESKSRDRAVLFSEAIISTLDRIRDQPQNFPIAIRDIRRARVPKYPFCVFFKVTTEEILVTAIFHLSRNPEIWKRRD